MLRQNSVELNSFPTRPLTAMGKPKLLDCVHSVARLRHLSLGAERRPSTVLKSEIFCSASTTVNGTVESFRPVRFHEESYFVESRNGQVQDDVKVKFRFLHTVNIRRA